MDEKLLELLELIFGDAIRDILYFLVLAISWAWKYEEKRQRILSWFYRVFAWKSLRSEKKYIEKNIQADIDGFKHDVNREVEGIAPYGLRLQWVSNANREAFIRDNQVIVKMNHYRNQDENFVKASLAYVRRGILIEARPYLDDDLAKAIDYKLAKMILSRREKSSQVAFFMEEIITPEIKKSKDLGDSCTKLENIDAHGLFTRMLLHEFRRLGHKLSPKNPEPHVRIETKRFTDFLNSIALRDRGQLTDLRFYQKHIKVGVILVADKDTILAAGYAPYYGWINRYCMDEYDAIFILAADNTIRDAEKVAKQYRFQQNFSSVKKNKYKMTSRSGTQVEAICIGIEVNKYEIRSKKALWKRQQSGSTKPI